MVGMEEKELQGLVDSHWDQNLVMAERKAEVVEERKAEVVEGWTQVR